MFDCATKLFGPFDMWPGITCTSDSECFFGASCNTTFGLCHHTTEHVIDCFLESMDVDVYKALYNFWKIPEEYSSDRMRQEIDARFVRPLCVGPGSMKFR